MIEHNTHIQDQELSMDELEAINGGGIGYAIVVGGGIAAGAYGLYKGYKYIGKTFNNAVKK